MLHALLTFFQKVSSNGEKVANYLSPLLKHEIVMKSILNKSWESNSVTPTPLPLYNLCCHPTSLLPIDILQALSLPIF